jgi:hypothetical protein
VGNRNGSADTAITASTLAQRLTGSMMFGIAATLKAAIELAQHEPGFAQVEAQLSPWQRSTWAAASAAMAGTTDSLHAEHLPSSPA